MVLNFVMIQSVASMCAVPFFGHLSDRVGRRKIVAIGCVAMMIWPFAYFALLNTKSIVLVFLAIVLALPIQDMQYGPQAALIAEAFTPRLRYSGSSLGYQLASVIAGGPAPLIATALFAHYHTGYAISIYIAACAAVSLVSAAFMPDYTGKDISMEYDD